MCCVTLCVVVNLTSQKLIVQELYEYTCNLPEELRHTQMTAAALYAVTNAIQAPNTNFFKPLKTAISVHEIWRFCSYRGENTVCFHKKDQSVLFYFISIPVPRIFYYFVHWATNAQLFHKLSHSYMFRHYRVFLRELVINTLPSYTSISNAAVGNTVYN